MLAQRPGVRTVFTMVRFGNVLDSSGSVMRRFRQQIADGGPVTVTHRDMIRYFMSIPEAASLVIQAGAMATGGEVFLLDMGDPIRIEDLARSMIRLSGKEVRDTDNPHGDVAIDYVGRAPRRETARGTAHRRRCGTDRAPAHPHVARTLAGAGSTGAGAGRPCQSVDAGQIARIHEILRATVEGYQPAAEVEAEVLAGR